ncbi:hypothetical protein RQX22_10045 [Sphingosinicella sp. GR2756]|uniref:Uncharacterized protein n=1 Tax=Sphingosinicella rhizophila TaxID=3050082 RepID=A0ABU3Q8M7_9SPHN|nr:hypothetical protein [Sphingosinicella sp. GR2756]
MNLNVRTQRGSNLLLATWQVGSGNSAKCVFETLVWDGSKFARVDGYPKQVEGECRIPGDQ